MSEAVAALEARGVTRSFTAPSLVLAVRSVTLKIMPGELAALIGPSGAGKSTLLSLLSGLLSPTNGTVLIDGSDLSGLDDSSRPRARNLGIGFVFQFHHLLPELTALENVMLPALIADREGWRPMSPVDIETRAKNLLEGVGLGARIAHLPTQLSGGEAQRAALARALMNRPAVVLADEPTGNLDQATALELMGMIQDLNRRDGQTFLIATHNQELVNRASRVLRMVNGELMP
jgi:lipoprotein-releasing system ATP-binding protein